MAEEKKNAEMVARRFIKAMKYIIAEESQGVTSIKEFAEKVGEFPQNISKMESGTRYPTIEQLCTLCTVFGISPEWILLGHGEMWWNVKKSVLTGLNAMGVRLGELEQMIGKPDKAAKKKTG